MLKLRMSAVVIERARMEVIQLRKIGKTATTHFTWSTQELPEMKERKILNGIVFVYHLHSVIQTAITPKIIFKNVFSQKMIHWSLV